MEEKKQEQEINLEELDKVSGGFSAQSFSKEKTKSICKHCKRSVYMINWNGVRKCPICAKTN